MATTLEDKLAGLSPERRQLVEQSAQELILEERALQSLRKLLNLTQEEMANRLNIAQEGISHLEQRQDLKLSTLRRYVEALGGHLNIVVDFPDRPSVSLAGLVTDPNLEVSDSQPIAN